MASSEDGSSDEAFLCLSMEEVIVSARRDYILIPLKALLEGPLTSKRQREHNGWRSSRPSATLESSNQVLRRLSPRHTSEQDFKRRDSRQSFCDITTPLPKINMPPSPPPTPTSSSVYSTSIMDTPIAPRKRNGRAIPIFEFPRYGQPVTRYPRRPRPVNVHQLPGNRDGELVAFRHTIEAGDKKADDDKVRLLASSVISKSAPRPKQTLEQPGPKVPADFVANSFIDAHFGVPCVTNSLRHILTCGHTICTVEPEVCAKNCKGPYDAAQLRDRDTPFECMQCITDHVQDMQRGRLAMFAAELADRARETDRSSEWIHDKIGFMQMAWRDEDLEEIKTLCDKGKGRYCQSLWIEPEMQDLVDAGNKVRATPARTSREQYASPNWTQRSAPESSMPQSRMSIEDRAYSPQSSISSVATTDSRSPSLQQSVTKLFARREKKKAPAAQPLAVVEHDSASTKHRASHAQDVIETDKVMMEFD